MTGNSAAEPVSDETRHNLLAAIEDEDSTEDLLRGAYRWVTPGKKFEDAVTTRITVEIESLRGIEVIDEEARRRKRQMKIAAAALAVFMILLITTLLLLIQ